MFVTGRAVLLAAAGVVPVALLPRPLTAWLWLALVAAVCALDAALAASPRRLRITRTTSAAVRLGEPARSTLLVDNQSGRVARGSIRDAWVPSAGAHHNRHPLEIPSGERRRVHTGLLPNRRGERTADLVTVRCAGPLGLAGRQAAHRVPGSVLVLPAFHSRRHLPSRLAMLREMEGRTAVMVRGQGTEFDSLREYVSGDDVRAIDWRASARSNAVVVRTWRPERDRRVMLVLDTGRLAAVRLGAGTRLDSQIEAALLLAALASHAGDRVDVVAVDTQVRARTAGQVGARLMHALAVDLARVEPALVETNWTRVAAVVRETLSQRGLVVLLTALDPSSVDNGLLPVAQALAAEHTVLLAAAGDQLLAELVAARARDTGSAYDAAAAERAGLERDWTAARLRRRGVEIVEAGPEELAPALADAYLRLKRAGRL